MNSLQLPSSKQEVKLFADNIENSLPEGKATELYVSLKYAEKLIDDLSKREGIRERIMNEVQNLEKEFDFMGCKIKKGEVGSRYDFTVCQDPEWDSLDRQIKELTILKKAREESLKLRLGKQPDTKLDRETGVITVAEIDIPPAKTSESFIVVTIK